jgi:hypothetical protein
VGGRVEAEGPRCLAIDHKLTPETGCCTGRSADSAPLRLRERRRLIILDRKLLNLGDLVTFDLIYDPRLSSTPLTRFLWVTFVASKATLH